MKKVEEKYKEDEVEKKESDYDAEYGSSDESDYEIVPPKNMKYVPKSNTVK